MFLPGYIEVNSRPSEYLYALVEGKESCLLLVHAVAIKPSREGGANHTRRVVDVIMCPLSKIS